MIDYQLNVPAILRRAEQLFGSSEIASRLPDKSWHRYTYADFVRRAKQLALALRNELGLVDGDRVGTFAWNHHEHLEVYLGAPAGGLVTQAVPDEKWSERPLAVVVFRDGQTADDDELRDFLAPNFARWWLPERFEAVDEIPKTAVGKFRKTDLRERFG